MFRALVVSSDRAGQEQMTKELTEKDCVVDNAMSTEKAMYFAKTQAYDIMVLPDRCDGRFDILDVAAQLQRSTMVKRTQIILIETSPKMSSSLCRTLRNKAILKVFSWYSNIGIILDWYHLRKKCKEKLSMAMRGRVIRNEVLAQVPRFFKVKNFFNIQIFSNIKVLCESGVFGVNL